MSTLEPFPCREIGFSVLVRILLKPVPKWNLARKWSTKAKQCCRSLYLLGRYCLLASIGRCWISAKALSVERSVAWEHSNASMKPPRTAPKSVKWYDLREIKNDLIWSDVNWIWSSVNYGSIDCHRRISTIELNRLATSCKGFLKSFRVSTPNYSRIRLSCLGRKRTHESSSLISPQCLHAFVGPPVFFFIPVGTKGFLGPVVQLRLPTWNTFLSILQCVHILALGLQSFRFLMIFQWTTPLKSCSDRIQ